MEESQVSVEDDHLGFRAEIAGLNTKDDTA